MRRIIYVLLVLFLLATTLSIFIKSFIVPLVEKQIKTIFAENRVSVEDITLKPHSLFLILKGYLASDFSVQGVRYDKLKIDSVRGRALLRGRRLSLSPLYAKVLSGEASGNIAFIIGKRGSSIPPNLSLLALIWKNL
ncbi:MAG: hypothetical protein NC916_02405 [Candidatus Omnitrophica bacterium]|nr:hypothetical protein [Candidatus Omnitrophota bacterium]